MAANNMAPREIKGTPGSHNLSDVVEDILNYDSHLPYEVIYIPVHPTKYLYRITCDDIQSVPKDRNYINSCLLQATSNEYAQEIHPTQLGAPTYSESHNPFRSKLCL
ncbi:unnamed protein product [Aspergillus oryzae]|uniref:Unnamed protein product n=1 Tax=Aspergillus oryzae TaxID=5062 RepID=A0AAN4YZK9_ASPOZ|nr:unnamed protein product [Aspergillus oryzae]